MRDLAGGGVVVSRGYRGLALSARWPGGVKPLSPLLAGACVGLKPSSPLRVRNERFWYCFWAQRCRRFQRLRVGGVQWCCWFHVAMFLRAVRGICRPARPDVGASAKKFALRAHNGQKLAFDGALGKYFRGDAAGAAALGKYFRGSTVVGSRRASLLCRVPGSRPLYWQC